MKDFWFEHGEAVKDFVINVVGSWIFFVSAVVVGIVAAFWIIVLSWFYFRPF